MNRFINIEVSGAQPQNHPSTLFKVSITPDILFFYPEDHLPINIKVIDTYGNYVHYEINLNPNNWMIWPWGENKTLVVSTSKGVEIGRIPWNSLTHGSQSEIAFDLWVSTHPNSKGVAIGTNNGMNGEWAHLYHQGKFSKVMLVEASIDAFNNLSYFYSNNNNVTLVNSLITPKGGDVMFYEAIDGEGLTNSVIKEHLLNFHSNIREIKKSSLGINELLIQNGFEDLDWLHIDVEGLDDQLIMALNFNIINKPKVIIYEKINNINNKLLEDFLHSNGYKIWVDDNKGFNNIAFLK